MIKAGGTGEMVEDSIPADPNDDDALIAEVKERFERASRRNSDNHKQALDDLRFLSGDHWTEKAKREREIDGRPCLTINKLPTFLHQVTNDQRQNVPAIKVSAVDSNADPGTAEVVQGLIRHIEYSSAADAAYDTAVNSAAAIGFGYFRLITDYCYNDSFDQDIRFCRIRNPFTVYTSEVMQADGSDMEYCILSNKLPRTEFARRWPDAKAADQSGFAVQTGDKTNQDWIDSDTVRVAEYYRVEYEKQTLVALPDGSTEWADVLEKSKVDFTGSKTRESARKKIMLYTMTSLDVLERTQIMCDWIPVFQVLGDELDIDGKLIRSGMIRHAKDPARMYSFMMPLSLATPIPTPMGWSTMGELHPGDMIFDDAGAPTRVVGESPTYLHRRCFAVEFADGSCITADAEHPWTVEERGKRKSSTFAWSVKTIPTRELDPKRHSIAVAGALQTAAQKLPLDPYLLGLWLGDGTAASAQITPGDDDIEEIRQLLNARGLDVGCARRYGAKHGVFTVHGGACSALREAALLGNKHIPDVYLRSSVEQRLDLLRGLMDSDGTISKRTHGCSYSSTDLELAQQVRELLHSLGIRTGLAVVAARVSKMANGSEINARAAVNVTFSPPVGVQIFNLARKRAVLATIGRRQPRKLLRHKIKAVREVVSVPVKCIRIDSPSHLFLAGHSMIPTHNTAATEEVALRPKIPFIGAEGQFEGYESQWEQANNRSFPFLEYKPISLEGSLAPPPQRQPMADVPNGMLTMAMHANDNIKATTGLFDSSLGARGNATSGVQERSQQRQGNIANYHYTDNLNRAVRHAGKCLVSMLPHYYDATRIVRIMGEDGKIESAPINQPMSPQQMQEQQAKAQQSAEQGERAKAIQTILNDLTVGEYDVTVRAGPSYDTLRQEALDSMVEVAGKWPKLMEIAGDKVIRAMDWPGADEIADRVEKTIPPEIRGDEDGDKGPMVQTPKGPIPLQQAAQMLAEMDQQIQGMGQALQQAQQEMQSGLQKAEIDAKSRETVAEINAVSKQDAEELKGMVALLIAKANAPPELPAAALESAANPDPSVPPPPDRADQTHALLQQMVQMMAQPRDPVQVIVERGGSKRRMAIQAPSGATYNGEISDIEDDGAPQ
jgi:hypothetical protein